MEKETGENNLNPSKHANNDDEDNDDDDNRSSYSHSDSECSSSVETDLREDTGSQHLSEQPFDSVTGQTEFDNPFSELIPAPPKQPRQKMAPPSEALKNKPLQDDQPDDCPLKSLKARKKRKAQRHRRQEKRKEVLVSMNKDQRIVFINEERERKKQDGAKLRERMLAGLQSNLRIVIDCEFEGK